MGGPIGSVSEQLWGTSWSLKFQKFRCVIAECFFIREYLIPCLFVHFIVHMYDTLHILFFRAIEFLLSGQGIVKHLWTRIRPSGSIFYCSSLLAGFLKDVP